jgi:hypothetical protein
VISVKLLLRRTDCPPQLEKTGMGSKSPAGTVASNGG